MTMKLYTAIATLLALIHQSYANLDIITLVARDGTWIQEAVATLVVGQTPNPITGDIALWSAIMMDQQDFLQGVTQNSPEGVYEIFPSGMLILNGVAHNTSSGYCQNLGENWCNFAYVLEGSYEELPLRPPGHRTLIQSGDYV